MRRTAYFAAAITVALAGPMTLPARAGGTSPETVSGSVVQLVRETPDSSRGADQDQLVLATSDGYVPIRQDDVRLTPGERVTAEVSSDGVAVHVVSARTAARTAATPADIDRQVYVGIVSPAGYTLDENTNTIETARHYIDLASQYWSSQTGGTIHFTYAGTVPKYVSQFGCGRTTDMWNEAVDRFAGAGMDVRGVGKYLLLLGPVGSSQTDTCDFGLGTLGALDAPWNATFVTDVAQSLYAHELGHNLGLAHANALRCNGVQDGIWDGSSFGTECARWRYEDLLDVMGYSGELYGEGNLNVAHLDDLGIDPTAIRAVSGPATVTIPPLSSTSAPGRGLRVTDTNGVTYYVEYRTDTGRDRVADVNPYHPSLGVLLYREDPAAYRGHGSYHLDATPHRSDDYDYDRALRPGTTFTSAAGTLTITTVRQDASGAVVEIDGGATTTLPDPPVVLEPATVTLRTPGKARRNGNLTLNATVLSRTNAVVPGVDVTFERRVGAGWVTVATATTAVDGVARAVVTFRGRSTFRAGAGEPVTYSSNAAVKLRRANGKG